jgi:hypothetical protein
MQLLNDISREYAISVKLHFEFRLRKEDYNNDFVTMHEAAQEMTLYMWTDKFKDEFKLELDKAATSKDGIDYIRYGWMRDKEIFVTNAFAIPIGNVRPFDYEIDDKVFNRPAGYSNVNTFLVFIALSAFVVMVVVLCMYYRLRQEHSALHKRKSMGGSLHQMWNKFSQAKNAVVNNARNVVGGGSRRTAAMGTYTGDRSYLESEGVQLSKWSALGDDQIEEDDYR